MAQTRHGRHVVRPNGNKLPTQKHYANADATSFKDFDFNRRLAGQRDQADEIGFSYACTMIGGFSVIVLVGKYLSRRFFGPAKDDRMYDYEL